MQSASVEPELPEPVAPVAVGDVVAGKYRVDHVLGSGAMGMVFAATHLELRQKVAIKLLLPRLLDNPVAVERFLREARATAQLRSEHVARVLDVGRTVGGVPFLVMEHLDGCDLLTILHARGPLPAGEAADLLLQACEGIAEAHARGIVHRDLKPQNLFVTRRAGGEELVKVLDFGISKVHEEGIEPLTHMSGFLGTPTYTAPEQLRSSRDADARSDIWSLGVVLQEVLTGGVPFEGDTVPELTLRIHDEAPRSPRDARPELSDALVGIIARCLQKDPAARYADVAELAQALEQVATPLSHGLASRATSALGQALRATAVTRDEAQGLSSGTPRPRPTAEPAIVIMAPTRPSANPKGPSRRWPWLVATAAVGVAAVCVAVVARREVLVEGQVVRAPRGETLVMVRTVRSVVFAPSAPPVIALPPAVRLPLRPRPALSVTPRDEIPDTR